MLQMKILEALLILVDTSVTSRRVQPVCFCGRQCFADRRQLGLWPPVKSSF